MRQSLSSRTCASSTAPRRGIIRIATSNGAKFLGESDRIGTLAPGKQADMVVMRGNPAANISDIERVEIVFKDGVGYDSAKLIESVRGAIGLH